MTWHMIQHAPQHLHVVIESKLAHIHYTLDNLYRSSDELRKHLILCKDISAAGSFVT